MKRLRGLAISQKLTLIVLTVFCSAWAWADKPSFDLEIKEHLFSPSELRVPANTKIKVWVHNRDNTPEEFESYELNREKVILGGQKSLIFIGPLPAGEYPFFGEFNPKSAQGKIIAE